MVMFHSFLYVYQRVPQLLSRRRGGWVSRHVAVVGFRLGDALGNTSPQRWPSCPQLQSQRKRRRPAWYTFRFGEFWWWLNPDLCSTWRFTRAVSFGYGWNHPDWDAGSCSSILAHYTMYLHSCPSFVLLFWLLLFPRSVNKIKQIHSSSFPVRTCRCSFHSCWLILSI